MITKGSHFYVSGNERWLWEANSQEEVEREGPSLSTAAVEHEKTLIQTNAARAWPRSDRDYVYDMI